MYEEFYSLSGLPFQLAPDPRFFFASSEHNNAMAHLTYGIHQGEGFIIITGDVGAGKTTLVDYLLTTLTPAGHVAAKVVTTQLCADDMLRMIAAAFNLFREGADKATLLKRIEEFATRTYAQGKRVLLVIDEAQNLPVEALEELRMLSNIIVRGTAPLQAILLAQPQFRNLLASPDLDQLRQRVTASYHLGPLNAAETRSYIEHRLTLVGWKRDPNFTDESFIRIFSYTDGVPRRINTLCSRLMLLGFLEEQHTITDVMVTQVADEMAKELGTVVGAPVGTRGTTADRNKAAPDNMRVAIIDLNKRMAAIEESVNRHDKAFRRALDIVARYLNGVSS